MTYVRDRIEWAHGGERMIENGIDTNPYPQGSVAASLFERLRSAARGVYARQWAACELLQHESQFLVGELRELERLRTEGKPAARPAAPAHLPLVVRVAVVCAGLKRAAVDTEVIQRGDEVVYEIVQKWCPSAQCTVVEVNRNGLRIDVWTGPGR